MTEHNFYRDYGKLTYEDIVNVVEKICKPHYKVMSSFAIGFSYSVPIDTIWVITEEMKYNGKRILLMFPDGKAHKIFKEIEEKEDFKLEQISGNIVDEISKKIMISLWDQNGNILSYPFTDDIWKAKVD